VSCHGGACINRFAGGPGYETKEDGIGARTAWGGDVRQGRVSIIRSELCFQTL